MAYPIPLVSEANAAQTLGQLYLNLQRSRPSADGPEPPLLVTLPTAWANKYQILLYGGAARHGWAIAGVTTPDDLAHVEWPGPILLHTHWFAALFQGAASVREAQSRLAQIQEQITVFRERTGARVIWTAHNVFPHGNAHPEAFLALRQWIFDTFDAVHILEGDHLEILQDRFGRPAPPTFTVPHMLYSGSLPYGVDRAMARAQFGLPHGGLVLGYFGSLQSYKRIPLLIDALDLLPPGLGAHAVIGGLPSDDHALRVLQARISGRRDVTLMARKLQDHEVQYIHAAADLMVLPYAETLNSGAAMMAATFRRPFLMPEGPAADPLRALGAATFAAEGSDSLSEATALAQALVTYAYQDMPHVIDDTAWQARQPAKISDAFFRALKRLG